MPSPSQGPNKRVCQASASPSNVTWRAAVALGVLLALVMALVWPRPCVRVETTLSLLVVAEGADAHAHPGEAEAIVRRLAQGCSLENPQVHAESSGQQLELVVRTSGTSAVWQSGSLTSLRRLVGEAASVGQFHSRVVRPPPPAALCMWDELYEAACAFADALPAKATASLVEQLHGRRTSASTAAPSLADVESNATETASGDATSNTAHALDEKIADLRLALSQLLLTRTEAHPDVIRLREELQRLSDTAPIYASHRIGGQESQGAAHTHSWTAAAVTASDPTERPVTHSQPPSICLDQYYQYWKQQSTQFRAQVDSLATRLQQEYQHQSVQVAVPARVSDLPMHIVRTGGLERIDWFVILGASLALSCLAYCALAPVFNDRVLTPNDLSRRTPGSAVVLVGHLPPRSLWLSGLKHVFAAAPRLLVLIILVVSALAVSDAKFLYNASYDPWWALLETMRTWNRVV